MNSNSCDSCCKDKKRNVTTVPQQQQQQGGVQKEEKVSYYRRPLPDICIDFGSLDGQSIFKRALNQGYLSSYFNLASQFHTQAEPAYCGLATLSMVLNTLSIDPGHRIWRGVWRWYAEEMLDCCIDLETVKTTGITIDEFICIATCNGALVDAFFASNSTVQQFREYVIESCQSGGEKILVVSYDRKGLNQTGTGHFSPIAGYDQESDTVLVMDVARFKYPPYWVSLETLFKSMIEIDKDSGKSRGYLMLKKSVYNNPLYCKVLINERDDWRRITNQLISFQESNKENKYESANQFIEFMVGVMSPDLFTIFSVHQEPEFQPQIQQIINDIKNTKLYKIIESINQPTQPNLLELLTLILFSLPPTIIQLIEPHSVREQIQDILREPTTNHNQNNQMISLLVNEIEGLKNIFRSLSIFCCQQQHHLKK